MNREERWWHSVINTINGFHANLLNYRDQSNRKDCLVFAMKKASDIIEMGKDNDDFFEWAKQHIQESLEQDKPLTDYMLKRMLDKSATYRDFLKEKYLVKKTPISFIFSKINFLKSIK